MLPIHPPRHDRVRVAGGIIRKRAGLPTRSETIFIDAGGRRHHCTAVSARGHSHTPIPVWTERHVAQ